MISTKNEKHALILLVAPLVAEMTMIVGFFIAIVLLLVHFGLL